MDIGLVFCASAQPTIQARCVSREYAIDSIITQNRYTFYMLEVEYIGQSTEISEKGIIAHSTYPSLPAYIGYSALHGHHLAQHVIRVEL